MVFGRIMPIFLVLLMSFSVDAIEAVNTQKQWDVNHPEFPVKRIPINTEEGTWMNLSVSPDGEHIAFDLLGDIYIIPIGGGLARPLTSSIAWDMQPRFSPDGKQIAFTSDQGGGDNIWLMNVDGSNPRAVSHETYRLLSSPTWSPDGRFIAARKHFTASRVNGAGEIWLYHIDGGEGLKLTDRQSQEKDLGEPVFAPNGQSIYFSQDITSGERFKYSRDSNKLIYAIKKIDLEKDSIESVVQGSGGSIRPTPSPDGKFLAFVRRISNQSTLFVKNLMTGEERAIYTNLDRDMQETWAIHGVYATMDWTPDSQDLVFWAKGTLHRVNIKTLNHRSIPFEVNHYRDIAEALRFPVEVSPDQFVAKALRWVTLSPTGDHLVFESAGYLYTQDLKSGHIQRLTKQTGDFETYPSFSSDGKWIVYATWNDKTLGGIRKVRVGNGKSTLLPLQPGHYIRPLFASDDQSIVFQAIKGGHLVSPEWSLDTGIFRVSAKLKKRSLKRHNIDIRKISETGDLQQVFNDRIYILKQVGTDPNNPRNELVSVNLGGNELRQHVGSKWADEFSISPDGKWLGFVERFQAFVVPFTQSSKMIELGEDTKILPIRKVSSSGKNLHWSQDSEKFQWSHANQLFQQSVAPLFAIGTNSDGHNGSAAQSSIKINLIHKADKPEGVIALVGARAITMENESVIEDSTIVIENNRIKLVGPSSEVAVPKGALVVDVQGKTIAPGFVDVHWHGRQGNRGIIPRQNWSLFATLAFGVTTIHDPFGENSTTFPAAEMQRRGNIVAPRIYSTGSGLMGSNSFISTKINNLEDARNHVNRLKNLGAISVKSYGQPRRDQKQLILQAARELEMMVVAEGEYNFQHDMTMIVDGHTGVEHSIPVPAIYEDVKQLWSQSQTGNTPTLVTSSGSVAGENFWYQQSDVWKHPLLSKYVPREILEPRARRRMMAPEEDHAFVYAARIAKSLQDLGVGVNLGAHGQREGLAAHWELWMFVKGGMTEQQALRAVTIDSAKYLGFDKDIGSLRVGKLADLVVFDENPLESIYNSDKVYSVMLNGRIYDAKTMNEIGLNPNKRKAFYFD